jgi:hypothetical protein
MTARNARNVLAQQHEEWPRRKSHQVSTRQIFSCKRRPDHLHGVKHFYAQEIKLSPSNHLSFEIFQTIDVALDQSILFLLAPID